MISPAVAPCDWCRPPLRGYDGLEVGVKFSGLGDGSHAELFAQYILSLLELNGMESCKELAN